MKASFLKASFWLFIVIMLEICLVFIFITYNTVYEILL
jgi:hypothetical protein